MRQKADCVSSVVLLGLAENLVPELAQALAGKQLRVRSLPFPGPASLSSVIEGLDAEVVFCAAEPTQYTSVLEAIGHQKPRIRLVVVSRQPEVAEWIEALEAGAWDYCAPPFDSTQLSWILASALGSRCASA
ncbi:MAG TPA: hypothetical protein VKU44_04645 [Terriglobia bacterium]|nr:hypothetical protein [Terriglobia bacterium]